MKITIDTKEDSHEEIAQVMEILRKVVLKESSSSSSYSSYQTQNALSSTATSPTSAQQSSGTSTSGFMNMFGDTSTNSSTTTKTSTYSSQAQHEEPSSNSILQEQLSSQEALRDSSNIPDTAPDFTSFLNLANTNQESKEEKEDDVKIEFF